MLRVYAARLHNLPSVKVVGLDIKSRQKHQRIKNAVAVRVGVNAPSKRQSKTGLSQVLEDLRKVAGGNGTTKGKLFERITKSLLQSYDLYRKRFREV